MAKRLFFYLLLTGLLTHPLLGGVEVGLVSPSFALEKLKLSSATRGVTASLPVLTAEQRDFWKENGLDVEWVPFSGSAPEMRAAAAGILNIGVGPSPGQMTAGARGVPVILVAEYISEYPYYLWVKTDSPYRHPRDLKGAKIGVTTLGGTMHAYGRVIAKTHEIEKDVRFVGAGGVVEAVAGLRAGAFQANVNALTSFVRLKLEGIFREIASTSDYLPKPWVGHTIYVRKDFAASNPAVVRKVIRAMLQASDFLLNNPRFAVDKIKSSQGHSEEEAKLVYKELKFNTTGKIDRKGVENARRFYIEYGILTEKAPPVDDLFTNEHLPG